MNAATIGEVESILGRHGLTIEERWTGDYGRSHEVAAGIGLPPRRLAGARHELHQRGVGSVVRAVHNPGHRHRGWMFLHAYAIPKDHE